MCALSIGRTTLGQKERHESAKSLKKTATKTKGSLRSQKRQKLPASLLLLLLLFLSHTQQSKLLQSTQAASSQPKYLSHFSAQRRVTICWLCLLAFSFIRLFEGIRINIRLFANAAHTHFVQIQVTV
jgi:hypothetical protein